MRRLALVALPALLLLAACSDKKPASDAAQDSTATASASSSPLQKAHWLVGEWEMEGEDGVLVESWRMVNDSLLTARVVMTNPKGDSGLVETIELRYRNGKAEYVPTVADQNNGQPIVFTIEELQDKTFLASNPSHEYPKRIRYEVMGDTALVATLEGDKPEESQTIEMKRHPRFR